MDTKADAAVMFCLTFALKKNRPGTGETVEVG